MDMIGRYHNSGSIVDARMNQITQSYLRKIKTKGSHSIDQKITRIYNCVKDGKQPKTKTKKLLYSNVRITKGQNIKRTTA